MAVSEFLAGLTLVLAALPLGGQAAPAALGILPDGQVRERAVLHGNVHHAVRDLVPVAHADPGLPMERMILSLRMRPEAKARLEKTLVDLQDPASPRYHQWLTPEQFGAEYGPSQQDLSQVSQWLGSQGFRIDEVARGGMTLTFSGDAGLVEAAFRTPIMEYQLPDRKVHANAGDPSIPAELEPLVEGVVSLHNIPRQANHTHAVPVSAPALGPGIAPQYRSGANNYIGPGDFALIYNVGPLYAANITGAGTTIAIVGRTINNALPAHWASFRTNTGLPSNTPAIVTNTVNGVAPTDRGGDEDTEADLDVEWSGAVAKGATIKYVCSPSTNTSDGVDLSAQFIVSHNLADVMSTSFGSCESGMGATELAFFNTLWSQAAAQGITAFVASGDSGAAGCDAATAATGTGRAVNGLGSTPFNICVGGTQFSNSPAFWSTTPGNGVFSTVSALGYIPEVAWNESGPSALWSTGGGASNVYARPVWQVVAGLPNENKRELPDVSLAAAGQNGYLVFTTGTQGDGFYVVAGTSASSPAFAGLMALIVQGNGRQGNANPTFYQLGNAQYTGGGAVFHDVSAGNNSVPGVTGFSAGPGYDQATGLGSVDTAALLANWVAGISTPISSAGLLVGRPAVFTATVSGAAGTGVTWSTTAGATITPGQPSTSATFTAARAGTYTITAAASAALARTATITVQVHDADLMGSGQVVTGLDVLDVLGHLGTSGAATDLNGDGLQDQQDLDLIKNLLIQGWN